MLRHATIAARPRIAYNSCRNRHCRIPGLARRNGSLPGKPSSCPCPTSTSSHPAAGSGRDRLPEQDCRLCYPDAHGGRTLSTIAADPPHLGDEIGIPAVLHTSQTPRHHPHVHCVVSGGGPSLDGARWIACRKGFFLPVRSCHASSDACSSPSCTGPSVRQPGLLRQSRRAGTARRLRQIAHTLHRLD